MTILSTATLPQRRSALSRQRAQPVGFETLAHDPLNEFALQDPLSGVSRDGVQMKSLLSGLEKQHLRGGLASMSSRSIHAVAARGTNGQGSALPHLNAIQTAFGRHDISGVRAHIGGNAREANEAMGAQAFARGEQVAFRHLPDVHTAAHEAAHVVQQRSGVSLSGGIGKQGDRFERHADQVADAVVRGTNAEGVLDRMSPHASATSAVQMRSGCPAVQLRSSQAEQSIPGGAQVIQTNGDPDSVISGMNGLAANMWRGGADFRNSNAALLIQQTLGRGNLANDYIPVDYVETSGINMHWTGSVRLRITDIQPLSQSSGTLTVTGGGSSNVGVSSSTTNGTSMGGSGSVSTGGYQGSTGGTVGVNGSATSSTTTGSTSGGTTNSNSSAQMAEQFQRFSARIVAKLTLQAEPDMSMSDYVNPFKWGMELGSAISPLRARTSTVNCGNIVFQTARVGQ